jgi:hypothetical protein
MLHIPDIQQLSNMSEYTNFIEGEESKIFMIPQHTLCIHFSSKFDDTSVTGYPFIYPKI